MSRPTRDDLFNVRQDILFALSRPDFRITEMSVTFSSGFVIRIPVEGLQPPYVERDLLEGLYQTVADEQEKVTAKEWQA